MRESWISFLLIGEYRSKLNAYVQFMDDTLITGDIMHQNVCTIKVILQLFKVVLGLKVNFRKSKLFDVYVQMQ